MRLIPHRLIALAAALSLTASPLLAAPRPAQTSNASLSGTASSTSGQALANVTVQLRNIATGQLAGTTTTNAAGAFSFSGLQAGQYAVEVVNAAGTVIGTSAAVSVAAGATVTGVAVTTTAALAGTTAGAAGGAAAAGGTGAATGMSTALIVGLVAAAAGVATVVAVNANASPSR